MQKATLKSTCLNSFVMKVVSPPVYVKVAHFCLVGWSSGCGGGRGRGRSFLVGYREGVVV